MIYIIYAITIIIPLCINQLLLWDLKKMIEEKFSKDQKERLRYCARKKKNPKIPDSIKRFIIAVIPIVNIAYAIFIVIFWEKIKNASEARCYRYLKEMNFLDEIDFVFGNASEKFKRTIG